MLSLDGDESRIPCPWVRAERRPGPIIATVQAARWLAATFQVGSDIMTGRSHAGHNYRPIANVTLIVTSRYEIYSIYGSRKDQQCRE